MAKRRKKSKKWLYWLFLLILLIAAGVVCYLVWDNYYKEDKAEVEKPTVIEEVVINDDKNEEIIEIDKKEEVIQYEGENPNQGANLTGVVTYAGVVGEELIIRVNIDQFLADGSCELYLSSAGNIEYSNVVRISAGATAATCEGFNVPLNVLYSEKYSINIKLFSDGKTGTINGEVKI